MHELTNTKVNVEDTKLTPLDLTTKIYKKTLTNIGRTDVQGKLTEDKTNVLTVGLASCGEV